MDTNECVVKGKKNGDISSFGVSRLSVRVSGCTGVGPSTPATLLLSRELTDTEVGLLQPPSLVVSLAASFLASAWSALGDAIDASALESDNERRRIEWSLDVHHWAGAPVPVVPIVSVSLPLKCSCGDSMGNTVMSEPSLELVRVGEGVRGELAAALGVLGSGSATISGSGCKMAL